ncbi:MAG: hypothetical protein V1734_05575 [Nanoarchaeota archaeon]
MQDIIHNLEQRLEPIPQNKRMRLRRKKSVDNYFKSREQSEKLTADGNKMLYAHNLIIFRNLEEVLRQEDNRAILAETVDWLEKSAEKITSTELEFSIMPEALIMMFYEVKEIVDGMLATNADKPHVLFAKNYPDGNYDVNKQTAMLGINLYLPYTCAHEYAHHVSSCSPAQMEWIRSIPHQEGFAYNVGRNALAEYAGNNSMPLLKKLIFKMDAKRMKKVSSSLNSRHRRFPNRMKFGAYGAAAFLIAEAIHGKQIYREIIRSANPAEYLINKIK